MSQLSEDSARGPVSCGLIRDGGAGDDEHQLIIAPANEEAAIK